MYGIMGGMVKTTLYLPIELKRLLERTAREEQRSEADIIRDALDQALAGRARPEPSLPLGASGDPLLAASADAHFLGFGLE